MTTEKRRIYKPNTQKKNQRTNSWVWTLSHYSVPKVFNSKNERQHVNKNQIGGYFLTG